MSRRISNNLETYSEEVQEIMGHPPSWIVRWGILVFFSIFLGILAGSYFFSYPQVVSVPFVLSTINPPAPIICKTSGRIKHWYAEDGQALLPGSVIAILENTSDYDEILLLEDILQNLTGNWHYDVARTELPVLSRLGTLQGAYFDLIKTYKALQHYLEEGFLEKRIALTESRIRNQEQQQGFFQKQWELKKQEFDVAKSAFSQDSAAYVHGGYGYTRVDYERWLQAILNHKSSLVAFEASMQNAKAGLLDLKESALQLMAQHRNELLSHENSLDEKLIYLKGLILEWKETYVLSSPIAGQITLTTYWSENQVVNAGERLATIVPKEETIIIARAYIPSSKLGEVTVGQKVKMKLSGFPYLQHGVLSGTVNTLSLVPEEQGYLAEICLSDGMTSSYSETLKFIQQMDGIADIITNETRLIDRFLAPMRSFVQN